MMMKKKITKFLALVLALASCDPVPLGDGDRRVVAKALVATVVLPTLDDTVARATTMRDAMHALAATPTQVTLDAAKAAWLAARTPWKETEAFGFGPATELRLGKAIDQTDIDTATIEAEIAGTTELTAAYAANLGANKKGFHALEYLVFASLAGFTTDPTAVRRAQFVTILVDDLVVNVTQLRDTWTTSYADVVSQPGSANEAYPTIQSVIDSFVNESVFLVELIAKARLGKPLGIGAGGSVQPELQESGPSDSSIDDMLHGIAGVQKLYEGGIDGLVIAQSPATDAKVRAAFVTAIAAVTAIPRPYATALTDHAALVQAAYDAVIELKRSLGTDVLAVLGATLKFNDNDGD